MDAKHIDPRITWTVAHMQRHLADAMTMPELAARVNLSPSRFRALFTAQTGVSPAQYLQWLRLRRARLLLERTFLTVKEVMGLVGYNDPSHFARDFRRQHGAPPTSFRGRDVTASVAEETSPSSDTPMVRRIGPPRGRDPGTRCA